MKYELPKDLKTYNFFCKDRLNDVSLRNCKRHCPDRYRQCWEQHLREDLEIDCAVENERKAERYVKCSVCGKPCLGLAFNKFLCTDCGNVEYYDSEQQKALMGDAYVEISEQEISDVLKQIKFHKHQKKLHLYH